MTRGLYYYNWALVHTGHMVTRGLYYNWVFSRGYTVPTLHEALHEFESTPMNSDLKRSFRRLHFMLQTMFLLHTISWCIHCVMCGTVCSFVGIAEVYRVASRVYFSLRKKDQGTAYPILYFALHVSSSWSNCCRQCSTVVISALLSS